MVKVYPNEVNMVQLGVIGAMKGIRTGTSPFGMPAGAHVRYIGRSVPWKGLKGDAFWSFAANHVNKKGVRGTLESGLKSAIAVSQKAAHTFGVALAQLADGRQVILPLKVVRQMEIAGKPITIVSKLEYGEEAYKIRKTLGIRGEYKGLAGATAGASMILAPV